MTRRKLARDGEEAAEPEELESVSVEIGAEGNPPGSTRRSTGCRRRTRRRSRHLPGRVPGRVAGRRRACEYALTVTGMKSKVLPALDDEFAKDLGYDSLDELRATVQRAPAAGGRADPGARGAAGPAEAARAAGRRRRARDAGARGKSIGGSRSSSTSSSSRASTRGRCARLGRDAEGQRETAEETVKCALVLDEVARREKIAVRRGRGRRESRGLRSSMASASATVRSGSRKTAPSAVSSRVYGGRRQLTTRCRVLRFRYLGWGAGATAGPRSAAMRSPPQDATGCRARWSPRRLDIPVSTRTCTRRKTS